MVKKKHRNSSLLLIQKRATQTATCRSEPMLIVSKIKLMSISGYYITEMYKSHLLLSEWCSLAG